MGQAVGGSAHRAFDPRPAPQRGQDRARSLPCSHKACSYHHHHPRSSRDRRRSARRAHRPAASRLHSRLCLSCRHRHRGPSNRGSSLRATGVRRYQPAYDTAPATLMGVQHSSRELGCTSRSRSTVARSGASSARNARAHRGARATSWGCGTQAAYFSGRLAHGRAWLGFRLELEAASDRGGGGGGFLDVIVARYPRVTATRGLDTLRRRAFSSLADFDPARPAPD